MKKYINKEIVISCLIGILIIIIMLLCGCEKKETINPYLVDEKYKNVDIEKICNFEGIGKGIFVDTTTGVLYYRHDDAIYTAYMTAILNEDGTPKNIKDYIVDKK